MNQLNNYGPTFQTLPPQRPKSQEGETETSSPTEVTINLSVNPIVARLSSVV